MDHNADRRPVMSRETNKAIRRYAKMYRNTLIRENFPETKEKENQYCSRLREMYDSHAFKEHNRYPSTDAILVYAVIAMYLELRSFGLSNEEIIRFTEIMFQERRSFFDHLIHMIDLLPNSFAIVRLWNINDHAKRVKDGSITYDYFRAADSDIEYRISKCMYVEMFRYYGIRELCKIFCNTDIRAYTGLTRHVQFIRHSDLSSGECCWDEIHRKQRRTRSESEEIG